MRQTARTLVLLDRSDARSTLEATEHGKTRSGGLHDGAGPCGQRTRADRVFRDIHGAEHRHYSNTVLIDRHGGGNAAGDD
ncbi:MAG: hypothetical protein ACREMY_05720, partial [bacterium]